MDGFHFNRVLILTAVLASKVSIGWGLITATVNVTAASKTVACPYPDGPPIFLSSGLISIQKASPGILCTLTAASLNNSVVSSVVPLARSYDGFDWERAAGEIATAFHRHQSWSCSSVYSRCQITLPPLQNGTAYRLASYSRTLSPRNEIARFLETATFGTTQSELAQFYNITRNGVNTGNLQTRMARWVWRQMNVSLVGMTSHREFWRLRANMRVSAIAILQLQMIHAQFCHHLILYHLHNTFITRPQDHFGWVFRIIRVKHYPDGELLLLVN